MRPVSMKQGTQSFKAVALTPEDLGWTEEELGEEGVRQQLSDAIKKGGLGGKALKVGNRWPSKKEVFAAIPDDCFKKETGRSLMYAAISVAQIAACVWAGWQFIPFTAAAWPLWVAYACAT